METKRRAGIRGVAWAALKPSLVEWKLITMSTSPTRSASLETFLGGMETRYPSIGSLRAACLETFLGGMETVHIAAFPGFRRSTLKPSLVEWKLRDTVNYCNVLLALKPSLVEWKHFNGTTGDVHRRTLETFLGGMETYAPWVLENRRAGP